MVKFRVPEVDLNQSIFPSIVSATLPATLPLFAGGLGLVGFLAQRRKRKNAAALAAA